MSARKVVTNAGWLIVVGLMSGGSTSAVAASAQKAPAKKRTVGDLLKRIEENTKKVKFSKSSSSLPQVGKHALPPPVAHENLAKIKPPARSSMYYDEGTNEAELEKITDQGIRQLYKLTQQFKTSKRRGELWLRLAELYVEKSRLIEYRLQQKYDDQIRDFQTGKVKKKPVLNLNASQDYNRKAIQLYEWFLRDFPQDPKVDQALFFLGYNYFELEQPEKGKDYYKRLTSQFPNSSYIEESYFALGEYYFDREKWSEALKHYEFVANNKRARLFSFALYKLAWCQYKTGKVKDALLSLEKVIRAGRVAKGTQDGSAGGASRIRLASEAQRDLVVFYAEAGSAKDARAYFTEIAGEKATFGLLEKLAYYYADTGNREGARFIFRELIQERPNAPKAYDYQYQIVSMYTSTDKGEVFKAELYNWIQTYSPDSAWAKANAKDHELVAKAHQLIETTLRNYVLQLHQTAQNSRVPTAQKSARSGYDLYFQTFREGAHLEEMHFFYAELLFDMGDFAQAAENYSYVVEHAPKSPYYEKAVLNTVLALEKGLPKEDQLKKQVDGKLDSVPFGKNVSDFEVASDRYIKDFPKGENVPAIRYKMGALYYYHNQFDRALETFNAIIKNYPKSPYAQYSANLTLDIYNLKKDYGGLEKAGQEILNNEELAKSSVGMQVKGVLQRAQFKKAQDLEASKDYAGAAQAYEEFAKKNAGGELATPASFNAAVNYEKSGDVAKAIAMYGVVIADHSNKHEGLKKNSSKFIAALYEKTGQYKRAAEAFETYQAKNEKEKEAIAFLYNAAVIRDGMNQYTAALNNYQKFFDKSRGAEKWEALFLMAKLYERRGSISKAQDLYKQYYTAGPNNPAEIVEAAYLISDIFNKKGKKNEAEEWCKKVIYRQKQYSTAEHPVGVSYAAECKYGLVAKAYDELRSIRIPANPANQKNAIDQKLAWLEKLKNQLKDVIRYDDGYMVVNSLALIGQAYQHMAASIYAVPEPKGLDAETLKKYREGIDGIARPFTNEAIKNYEAAIKKGFELEGYNEGLKTAQRELNRLKKEVFPDYGEKALIAKLTDVMGVESDDRLANAWKTKDENTMVEAVAKVLGKDQNDLKALNALANFYLEHGKPGMARIIFARAQKAHPNEPGLYNNLGVISLNENKQRPAITNFRKAMEVKRGYAIGAANLGSIFVEYRDYARAAELLAEGYSTVSSDLHKGVAMDVANNYALALSGAGDLDKAESIFKTILKNDNQNTTALLNYTILLVYKKKDKREAEKMLARLKFLLEDSHSRKRLEDMEKALNEN